MCNKKENTGRYGIYSVFAYYPKTPEMINFKTKQKKKTEGLGSEEVAQWLRV